MRHLRAAPRGPPAAASHRDDVSHGVAAAVSGLCRLALDFRLLAILLTLAAGTVSGATPTVVAALLILLSLSYLALCGWRAAGPVLVRHPLLLGADLVLTLPVFAVVGTASPFYYVTLTTALLAGALYRWRGALVFAVLLSASYWALLSLHGVAVDVGAGFQTLIVLPLLYPAAGAAGVALRRLLAEQAGTAAALRDAAAMVVAAQERARLAREMHDSVTKSLYGIGLSAAALPAWIARDPRSAERRAAQIATAAEQVTKEARQLIAALRADSLDGPLAATVEEVVAVWASGAGVRAVVDADAAVAVSDTARYELVSMLREALTNVDRHARAGQVQVGLAAVEDSAVLRVVDDGVGMCLPPEVLDWQRSGHYGLVGLHERSRRAGGTLAISATPGRGTCIEVVVPLVRLPVPAAGRRRWRPWATSLSPLGTGSSVEVGT